MNTITGGRARAMGRGARGLVAGGALMLIGGGASLLVAGCAAPPAGGPAPASPSAPAAPLPVLAGEQRWLAAWFDGTPVGVSAEGPAVRLRLPLRHAFAADAAQPLPPLQAVLQKLAASLQRQPGARLEVGLAAPPLRARQAAIRQQLQALGVAGWRVQAGVAPAADQLDLCLVPAPPAIERLDDRDLPPPARDGSAQVAPGRPKRPDPPRGDHATGV